MNWRYLLGSSAAGLRDRCLSHSYFPLTRYVPPGMNCLYDMQRFANTKQFPTIFDVGANVGQSASGFVKFFPSAQILCFEPASQPFAELSRAFASNPNVQCFNLALGSGKERRNLSVAEGDSELNTFSTLRPDVAATIETVDVSTIDDVCREWNLSSIDLLKMDVQGWELEILKGAANTLRQKRVRFIFAEVGFSQGETDMTPFVDLHRAMEDLGFVFCGLYDCFRWGPHKSYVGFANALYVQPDFGSPAAEARLSD
ncbi:MAG: FkbM family methyltransferase [Hyphomicrobium sp.]